MLSHCLAAGIESLFGGVPSAWSLQKGMLFALPSLSLIHSLIHSFIHGIDTSSVLGTM